jgi:glutamyl/glutaminyl-tRNA synthetase
MITHFNKTRIAPTPSGYLHLGNILSFSIAAGMARKYGAAILLRIDDLDRDRADDRYIRDIFDTLHFLDIPWDEGPGNEKEFIENYSQLNRMDRYNRALAELAEKDMVFACVCSRRELLTMGPCLCREKNIPLNTANVSWRLITGGAQELTVKNYNREQVRSVLPPEMCNFVVKKKDGYPAYQLASVVDDLFYGVDLIVRGADLWPSTLAQHVLAGALGWHQFSDITFFHHPLLVESSGRKMSKSAGAASVKYLRETGRGKAEVFGAIGAMLGVDENISSWESLAELSAAIWL